jgi:radical SAM protein with 4Fe4S-binding SPASM domain
MVFMPNQFTHMTRDSYDGTIEARKSSNCDVLTPAPSPTYLLARVDQANACFFRSGASGDGRKALVQITERCNLHCAHCFVSSVREGSDLGVDKFQDLVLPRLLDARVRRLTLTGGEPFAHPEVLKFCEAAARAGLPTGICTNATTITDEHIDSLRGLGGVHVNVSFDGFSAQSHGKFRGAPDSFDITLATTRKLAAAGLLQGILSTPNALTEPREYRELAAFAVELGANYLLMNPLSSLGRGVKSKGKLSADAARMDAVREQASIGGEDQLELVPIRFPNAERPLSPCVAGDIIYVFVNGDVAVCPYLVFAARTPQSQYEDQEFLAGNVLEQDIAEALDGYNFARRFQMGANAQCATCSLNKSCGKGCPAAVVAAGQRIGDRDVEVCPLP